MPDQIHLEAGEVVVEVRRQRTALEAGAEVEEAAWLEHGCVKILIVDHFITQSPSVVLKRRQTG